MFDSLNYKNAGYADHDLAVKIACRKFEETYSKEKQPEWLKYCMSMRSEKNQSKNWVIKMLLMPKPELEPGQYWHWNDNGIPILMQIDPLTKNKEVVICGGCALDAEVFFEVEVDFVSNVATIITDIDPNKLNGERYEMNMR